jgi:hypothetical protein
MDGLVAFVYFFDTGSHYVAQPSLKFAFLSPQPPECWDYRHVLLHLAKSKNFLRIK